MSLSVDEAFAHNDGYMLSVFPCAVAAVCRRQPDFNYIDDEIVSRHESGMKI